MKKGKAAKKAAIAVVTAVAVGGVSVGAEDNRKSVSGQ